MSGTVRVLITCIGSERRENQAHPGFRRFRGFVCVQKILTSLQCTAASRCIVSYSFIVPLPLVRPANLRCAVLRHCFETNTHRPKCITVQNDLAFGSRGMFDPMLDNFLGDDIPRRNMSLPMVTKHVVTIRIRVCIRLLPS